MMFLQHFIEIECKYILKTCMSFSEAKVTGHFFYKCNSFDINTIEVFYICLKNIDSFHQKVNLAKNKRFSIKFS